MTEYPAIKLAVDHSINILKIYGKTVDTGHWQGISTKGHPDLVTQELVNLTWQAPIPLTIEQAQRNIEPMIPWAEDHFQERVGRKPLNPGVEYENWPFWMGQKEFTQSGGVFSHTYMERFWPKRAGGKEDPEGDLWDRRGIRYEYGDLDDVLNLLRREPYTRQATFPIFFPEDTGAVHGGRIPCTLHYHFMLRDDRLHLWYPIRSCDAYRHFRDDVYMACRLNQWVLAELMERELRSSDSQVWVDVSPGDLYFTAYSFHVHMGDIHRL